jgi:hypothetical protein
LSKARSRVGAWSLHIQCDWTVEQGATVLAAYRDFAASQTSPHEITHRIRDLIVDDGPTAVQERTSPPVRKKAVHIRLNPPIVGQVCAAA